eukprot:Skav218979  [mRNA]  locus=scaffold1532:357566:369024:+ [translate_table: standard]
MEICFWGAQGVAHLLTILGSEIFKVERLLSLSAGPRLVYRMAPLRRSRTCLAVVLTAPLVVLGHILAPEGSALALAFFGSKDEDPVDRTKQILREADAVFFDVDSTVVTTEGIDLIGKCFGIMKEISELTHKAMNGNVKFQDAMAERLQLMADHGMTKEKLEKCVKTEGAW